MITMEQDKQKDEEKYGWNPYIQFGSFANVLLGTVKAEFVYEHVKHSDSKSAEAY